MIAERLRRGERIPGFGHSVYKNGDARGSLLLDLVGRPRRTTNASPWRGPYWRSPPAAPARPNVDFALATLVGVAGMVPGSGEAIFAVARTAGWLAHAMEEYAKGSLLRLRAAYVGPLIR